jgi:tetratricopeptide (TPR) repeat protein
MVRPASVPVWLFAVVLAAATLWGGQVSTDALPLVDGWWSGVLGGPELPITLHLALGIVVVGTVGFVWLRQSVLQTTNLKVLLALVTLVALIIASIGVSNFRLVSIASALEWLIYCGVLVGIVAVAGRGVGPKLLLAGLATGGGLLALKAISEYGQMRAIDATWRPFAGWVQQNALAGMLVLAFFAAVGLAMTSDRVPRLFAILAVGVIGFGIVLSQSKGGLLSLAIGLVVLVAVNVAWKQGRKLAPLGIGVALVVLLTLGLKLAPATPGGGEASPLNRVAARGETQAQSEGFRKLLWQSAWEIARETPTGTGMNTFRYVGTRPGLTPPTHFAHSTYLQLASDASPLAALSLLAMIGMWLREMFRGAKALTDEQNTLRAAVVAAVVASAIHNQLDNLLYHFGIGVAFFGLLGVGLQLAADGSGPEFVPSPMRRVSTVIGCGVTVIACWVVMWGEQRRVQAVTVAAADTAAARSELDRAIALVPFDGDAYALRARTQETAETALTDAELAVAHSPSLRNLRFLAGVYERMGRGPQAIGEFRRALRLDPNNLPAWLSLVKLYASDGDVANLRETVGKMERIESTSYFKVRAIPEVIPTEIAEARATYAPLTSNLAERKRLLFEALATLSNYALITVPRVREASKASELGFAGESLEDAERKLSLGQEIIRQLDTLPLASTERERLQSLRVNFASGA